MRAESAPLCRENDALRLALVGTPRSGNSWLRHMLAQLLELHEVLTAIPDELNWHTLPRRALLQTHWPPEPRFVSRLQEHGFHVVVVARHPLDVLVSILAYSQHDDSARRWLGGACGNEASIAGASPLSEAFLTYATGPRAKAILNVSAQWWDVPEVCRVRYEDLVRDAAAQLEGILAALGLAARRPAFEIALGATTEKMRAVSVAWLYHVWQATPGLWKRFLPAAEARRICAAHQTVLKTYGYVCDPDDSLAATAAQQEWERFDVAALKRIVHGVKRAFYEAEARHQRELERQRADLQTLTEKLADVERSAQQVSSLPRDQFRELVELGPWSLGAARTLQSWSRRFPRLGRAVKLTLFMFFSTLPRLGGFAARK